MTMMHAGLELYRDQLRDAIAQQLHEHSAPLRRQRAVQLGGAAAAAIAAGTLAVTLTGGSSVSSADAAILHRVAAALTAPPATILHERALVTAGGVTQPYELWVESAPPHSYHVFKWGHAATGTDTAPYDPAAELHSLVNSGHASVDGSTTIDGVPAYRLTVTGSSDRFLNGTAYVSQSNYHPLEIDTTGNGGERIVVQTYEYLPATAANLRLVHQGTGATAPSIQK